jgi:hypothetical protein
MENNNTQMVAQDEPVNKMKLSEILEAVENQGIEFDVPGVLLFFGEDGCHTVASLEEVESEHERLVLRMAGLGVPHMVASAMCSSDARSMAMIAEAYSNRIEYGRQQEITEKAKEGFEEWLKSHGESKEEGVGLVPAEEIID